MAEGWQAYQFGQFDKAIQWFESAAQKASPNSEAQAKALYALGTAYHFRRPTALPDKARERYEKVLAMAPESEMAAWALFSIARIEAAQKAEVQIISKENREKIAANYQKVIDKYPNSLAGQEAVVTQQALKLASLEPAEIESAIARIKKFLQAYPNSPYRSAAWTVLSNAYDLQRKYEDQLNALIQVLETLEDDPTNPIMVKPATFWGIATVAEYKAGDLETAKKYHLMLQQKFPRDTLVYSSQKAVERINRKQAELKQEAAKAGGATP